MRERQRQILLILIMTTVSLIVGGIAIGVLYNTAFEEERERLVETAQSQARLIEAVARFDAAHVKANPEYHPEGAVVDTLSQIIDAHTHYKGFGETGEFTLARREGDNIVFLLRHRHSDLDQPKPVALNSKLAEPMRRALSGLSGTVVGLDYRGEMVLAAYEPVSELNLGIVAKIDLTEIRAPFVKAGIMVMSAAFLVVLVGVFLFYRVSNPIIWSLEERTAELVEANEQLTHEIEERKQVEQALQVAHDELERRVEKRTEELMRANKQLQREIEERKRVEEQILKSKVTLQNTVDGISDPLVMLDKTLTVVMLNEAAVEYYQLTDYEDAIGRPCFEALRGESSLCSKCKVPSVMSEGRSITLDRKGLTEPERFEQVTVYPLQEGSGEVTGCILRISDITERKEVEKLLIRADRLSSLGQLSGGIAHEIRNPLSGINLFLDLLYDDEQFERTDKELQILEEMKKGITKIDGIIRRILDFAKEPDDVKTRTDLNSLIEESLKLWYSKVRNRKIKLELSLEQGLPTIVADPIGIQQVLNNLVQNAVEAMAGGGLLQISTQKGASSFYKDRQVVKIKVQDTGPGIAPDQQERIFDPFFTTKSTGTGLGLSISHKIIERNGGIISLESAQDELTTFKIELPMTPKN